MWKLCYFKNYDNTPMQYTTIFHGCKNDNFQMKKIFHVFFFQNIEWGYTFGYRLKEAVLTSTHNLCFRAKINQSRTNGPIKAHLTIAQV